MATNISNIVFQSGANLPAVNLVNDDTLNLFATGLVVATGTGTSPGVRAAGNNILNISGDILSFEDRGIDAIAGGNVFNIASTATIFGLTKGIFITGASNVVNNAGDIGGGAGRALDFIDGSATLVNSGNIRSTTGFNAVVFGGANNSVTNSGHIEGGADALQFEDITNTVINTGTLVGARAVDFDGASGVNAFFNTGTLTGREDSGFDGSEGQELIINNGLIQGVGISVELFGGNDVYDGRNGSVVGAI